MIGTELGRLTTPGSIGYFNYFEVIEIFATEANGTAFNILTLAVGAAEGGDPGGAYLTKKPLKVKGVANWTIGIKRSLLSFDQFAASVRRWQIEGVWSIGDELLSFGALTSLPFIFVPADGYAQKHWNRILKNNFWNGSYVLELADAQKLKLAPLFEKPVILQDLAEKVLSHVPIDLAALSDRLGNIIIQLPVTAATSTLNLDRKSGTLLCSTVWHRDASPRPLRFSVEQYIDEAVQGYWSAEIVDEETRIPFDASSGGFQWRLWDDANGLLLGASSESSFLTSASINMNVGLGSKRRFSVPTAQQPVPVELQLFYPQEPMIVGEPTPERNGAHSKFRMYREEQNASAAALTFVQYGSAGRQATDEHGRALDDLRKLIHRHGTDGAWLWDPYLSAKDLLNTLFFSSAAHAPLRALSAGEQIPVCPGCNPNAPASGSNRRQKWMQTQQAHLNAYPVDTTGLNLTYRIAFGTNAFSFHDRFLIFPKTNQGALAWSLGTSVNALGKQHHILQKVTDGQLVADAFEELWNRLDDPQHLVWQCP